MKIMIYKVILVIWNLKVLLKLLVFILSELLFVVILKFYYFDCLWRCNKWVDMFYLFLLSCICYFYRFLDKNINNFDFYVCLFYKSIVFELILFLEIKGNLRKWISDWNIDLY